MKITTSPVRPEDLTHRQTQSAIGALIGSAVGDALGAPFEFEIAGTYSARFPKPVLGGRGEMIGGGGFCWAPGEFTDDTQMALAMAESIRLVGGLDVDRLWTHFYAWKLGATDIGTTTVRALSGDNRWTAAEEAHRMGGFSASNGSLMRITPVGIVGVRWGRENTVMAAREQSGLTHFDSRAGWSAAIAAEIIRQLILGGDFAAAVTSAAEVVEGDLCADFRRMLDANWNPAASNDGHNGLAMVCLAQAVWAVRHSQTYEDAVVRAVDLGDDADTVAAVTGAFAGALHGIQQIPARWVTYLNGKVRQPDGEFKNYSHHELANLALTLVGRQPRPMTTPEPIIPITNIAEVGVNACNLLGAETADPEMGIISLCRMEDRLAHLPYRREYFILDSWGNEQNPHLHAVVSDAVSTMEAFLAEGREVVVHCHGGRSRTGLILKAWYMKHFGVDHDEADVWLTERWPHYATWNDDFFDFLSHEWSQ